MISWLHAEQKFFFPPRIESSLLSLGENRVNDLVSRVTDQINPDIRITRAEYVFLCKAIS